MKRIGEGDQRTKQAGIVSLANPLVEVLSISDQRSQCDEGSHTGELRRQSAAGAAVSVPVAEKLLHVSTFVAPAYWPLLGLQSETGANQPTLFRLIDENAPYLALAGCGASFETIALPIAVSCESEPAVSRRRA